MSEVKGGCWEIELLRMKNKLSWGGFWVSIVLHFTRCENKADLRRVKVNFLQHLAKWLESSPYLSRHHY